jgi:hypothetical protein
VVSEPDATKRRDALLIWAAARERAEDEATRLQAAAHTLHVRATQERAQAATNRPEETSTAREVGGRGRSGWHGEGSSKRLDSHCKVSGQGRV